MRTLLKKRVLVPLLLLCVFVGFVWAETVSVQPYGIATPKWYGYSAGVKGTYYLEQPTLTADDQVVVEGVAQTLTNKTLTSPSISNPTITGTITATGGVSGTNIADVERHIPLPIAAMYLFDGTYFRQLTDYTAPGLEVDDLIPNVVWADGETTPAYVSFRIPSDYASGGAFKVLATESDSTTPNKVDFQVYINSDGAAADAAATDQTPVALAGTTATPDEVTLTPATDFSSLAAGNWVTLGIWRDDVAAGTGDLEVKGLDFYYTATQ